MKKLRLGLFLLACFCTGGAFAFDGAEKQQFIKDAEIFLLAYNMLTYNVVVDYISPEVMQKIATDNKTTIDALKNSIPAKLRHVANVTEKHNYTADFNSIKTQSYEDGLLVALMPMTYDVVDKEGKNLRLKNQLIGVRVNERWYFLNSDEESLLKIYQNIYPELGQLSLDKLGFEFLDEEYKLKKGE